MEVGGTPSFPATWRGLVWHREDRPDWGCSDREMRRRLLGTWAGTAVEPAADAALAGTLRDTEPINTCWRLDERSGDPVGMAGYIAVRSELAELVDLLKSPETMFCRRGQPLRLRAARAGFPGRGPMCLWKTFRRPGGRAGCEERGTVRLRRSRGSGAQRGSRCPGPQKGTTKSVRAGTKTGSGRRLAGRARYGCRVPA